MTTGSLRTADATTRRIRTTAASTTVRLDAEHPQAEVPARTWQTARLLGPDPALVTCVVSPGFDFADFELADP